MSEFSFSNLIQAGAGAHHALRRELETRAARHPLKPGYVYGSPADLLLKHGTEWVGRPLPAQYEHLRGMPNLCFGNALVAAEQDSSLRYVEGFYMVQNHARPHAWCINQQGELLELTLPTQYDEGVAAQQAALPGDNNPWLPPDRWAYVGLPFDVKFIRRLFEEATLPALDCFHENDPGSPIPSMATDGPLRVPYSFGGWPL